MTRDAKRRMASCWSVNSSTVSVSPLRMRTRQIPSVVCMIAMHCHPSLLQVSYWNRCTSFPSLYVYFNA